VKVEPVLKVPLVALKLIVLIAAVLRHNPTQALTELE
jgi:hypothetical protein